jgi:hypothetical protein
MKILTTSDLVYVSGSNGIDSATGSFGNSNNYGASSGTSNAGCWGGPSQSQYQTASSIAFAVAMGWPEPYSAAAIAAAGVYLGYCGADGGY